LFGWFVSFENVIYSEIFQKKSHTKLAIFSINAEKHLVAIQNPVVSAT